MPWSIAHFALWWNARFLNHDQAGQSLARLVVIHAICCGYGSGPRNDGPLNETLVASSDLASTDPLIGPPLMVTLASGAQIVPGTVPELTVSFAAS